MIEVATARPILNRSSGPAYFLTKETRRRILTGLRHGLVAETIRHRRSQDAVAQKLPAGSD